MLVLKRKEGQWVEIVHRSGDVIRVRVYDIQAITGTPSRANLAFDDSARNFEIRRPERRILTPKPQPPIETSEAIEPPVVAEAVIAIDPEGDAPTIAPEAPAQAS
jgi:hypothetical protein